MARHRVATGAVILALAAAGTATAAAVLGHLTLRAGRCVTIAKTRVCAAKAAPPVTVTVAPSPIGQTFTGNGDQTLAPITLAHGDTIHWTSQPDQYGFNDFSVTSRPGDTAFINFDNGNNATSGQSYIAAGTYTLSVTASGAWTVMF